MEWTSRKTQQSMAANPEAPNFKSAKAVNLKSLNPMPANAELYSLTSFLFVPGAYTLYIGA